MTAGLNQNSAGVMPLPQAVHGAPRRGGTTPAALQRRMFTPEQPNSTPVPGVANTGQTFFAASAPTQNPTLGVASWYWQQEAGIPLAFKPRAADYHADVFGTQVDVGKLATVKPDGSSHFCAVPAMQSGIQSTGKPVTASPEDLRKIFGDNNPADKSLIRNCGQPPYCVVDGKTYTNNFDIPGNEPRIVTDPHGTPLAMNGNPLMAPARADLEDIMTEAKNDGFSHIWSLGSFRMGGSRDFQRMRDDRGATIFTRTYTPLSNVIIGASNDAAGLGEGYTKNIADTYKRLTDGKGNAIPGGGTGISAANGQQYKAAHGYVNAFLKP